MTSFTTRFLVLSTLLSSALLGACAAPAIDDELAVDDAVALDDGKADGAGTYTFYFVEQDMRRCASPFCGGTYYRLANARTTRCLDGAMHERCYAASSDWAPANLDDSGMAKVGAGPGSLLVRATIRSKSWGSTLGKFAELRITEAWPGQLPVEHEGTLAKIEDTGVRCAKYPCPSLREKKLNSSVRADLAEVGWEDSGATDDQIADALDQMHGTGLIIAGDRYRVSGPGGTAKARSVTQFWLRATNDVCPIIDCAAPPMGCHYEGAQSTPCDAQTCGHLVCGDPL